MNQDSPAIFDYEEDADASTNPSTRLVDAYLACTEGDTNNTNVKKWLAAASVQGVKKAPSAAESQLGRESNLRCE
jgi:hypothetical protein